MRGSRGPGYGRCDGPDRVRQPVLRRSARSVRRRSNGKRGCSPPMLDGIRLQWLLERRPTWSADVYRLHRQHHLPLAAFRPPKPNLAFNDPPPPRIHFGSEMTPRVNCATVAVCRYQGVFPMRVAVMTAPGEVRVEDRADPTILKPTDAI